MGMVVSITNITDAPESKKTPTRLAIYTTHLDPGETLTLPASMVDTRLRKLETDKFIAIGQLPSWYEASKARKLGRRNLTPKELEKRLVKPKAEKVEEAPKKRTTIKLEELSAPKDEKKTDTK